MEKENRIRIIFGVIILYFLLTSAFSMLKRITDAIFEGISVESMNVFLLRNGLWIITFIILLTYVCFTTRKYNKEHYSSIIKNRDAVLIVGILIILDGLMYIASILPMYIGNAIQNINISNQFSEVTRKILLNNILSHIVSIVISICQVLLGIYLMKYGKKSLNESGLDSAERPEGGDDFT